MGKKNAYTHLVGKTEGMRPLGRPRHRWKVGSLFYDAFSVTRLNSVGDRVISE
jgi:hypothetical protein